jgi:hypothetical protein
MTRKYLKIGLSLLLPLFCFCGPRYNLVSMTKDTEAGTLKTFCEQNNIQSPDTKKADMLFTNAQVNIKKGKTKEARREMDLASIYYRLALSKKELEKSRERLAETSSQLNEYVNQLYDNIEILEEMKKVHKIEKKLDQNKGKKKKGRKKTAKKGKKK